MELNNMEQDNVFESLEQDERDAQYDRDREREMGMDAEFTTNSPEYDEQERNKAMEQILEDNLKSAFIITLTQLWKEIESQNLIPTLDLLIEELNK